MTRRTFWIILALGAALRLLLISNAGLWYDENFTLILSRLPFARMLAATIGDVHPPLWYVLLWPLGRIPDLPVWIIRLPAALLSIASLAIYPRLMRGLHVPPKVQTIALVMLAILPMQLHYAQEGRMYALLEVLAIVGAIAVLESRPLLLGLATAGLLYTQNYGAFYVATLAAVLVMVDIKEWWRNRNDEMADVFAGVDDPDLIHLSYQFTAFEVRARWLHMGLALAAGIIVWLPWLPIALRQADIIAGNYWIFDLHSGAMLYSIFHLFWSLSLPTSAGNLAGMLLTFAVLIAAAWYLLTQRPGSWLVIACLAAGPVVLALIASFVAMPVLHYRPLIGVTPFLYLACAYALSTIVGLRRQLYAACFIAPVLTLGLLGYYRYLPQQKTVDGNGNMQAAVDAITADWQPGDLIVDANAMGWVNIIPYMNAPQVALPICADKFPGGISPATYAALQVPMADMDALPPHKRIWFVAVKSAFQPPCEDQRIDTITAGHAPYLIMSQSEFLFSALWLLRGE